MEEVDLNSPPGATPAAPADPAAHNTPGKTSDEKAKEKEKLPPAIAELEPFENNRRAHYEKEHRNIKIYLSSFQSLLQESSLKTVRLVCFLESKIGADRAYAQSLLNLREVAIKAELKERKNLSASDKEKETKNALKTMAHQQGQIGKEDLHKKSLKKAGVKKQAAGSNDAASATGVVDDCYMMQMLAAQKYEKLADQIQQEIIVEKLKVQVANVAKGLTKIEEEGQICIQELDDAEAGVEKMWQRLNTMAADFDEEKREIERRNKVADLWKLDMQYRVAVNTQKGIMSSVLDHLETMLQGLKQLESERRKTTVEALMLFLNKHEAFWNELIALKEPLLTNLNNVDSSVDVINSDMDRLMEAKLAELAAKPEAMWKDTPKEGEPAAPELAAAAAHASQMSVPFKFRRFEEQLQSPLGNELFVKAVMMTIKVTPILPHWQPCVLVVTRNRALHIFHATDEFTIHSEPDRAFWALLPKVELNFTGDKKKHKVNFEKLVVPQASVDLNFCVVNPRPKIGAGAFELREIYKHGGMTYMFKAQGNRKFLLQAKTKAELDDFLETVGLKVGVAEVEDEPADGEPLKDGGAAAAPAGGAPAAPAAGGDAPADQPPPPPPPPQ